MEDVTWGGDGGGVGRSGKHDKRKWAKEFAILAAMPCNTSEERQVRDRKVFLLDNTFVDVSVFKTVEIIKNVVESMLLYVCAMFQCKVTSFCMLVYYQNHGLLYTKSGLVLKFFKNS